MTWSGQWAFHLYTMPKHCWKPSLVSCSLTDLWPTSSRGITFGLKKTYFSNILLVFLPWHIDIDVNRYRYMYIDDFEFCIGFRYSTVEHLETLADL